MQPKFSILSDYSKKFGEHYSRNQAIAGIREHYEGCSLLFVMAGEEPIAFIAYTRFKKGTLCEIQNLEAISPQKSREFKKQFGVYPGRYLLETLVRNGVQSLSYGKRYRPGKKLVKRALNAGLVKKTGRKALKVMPLWEKAVFARKIIK